MKSKTDRTISEQVSANSPAANIVQNCSMKVRCNENWEAMQEIQSGVRWCCVCNEAVYRVVTIQEFREQVAKRHCICVVERAPSTDNKNANANNTEQTVLLGSFEDEDDDVPY